MMNTRALGYAAVMMLLASMLSCGGGDEGQVWPDFGWQKDLGQVDAAAEIGIDLPGIDLTGTDVAGTDLAVDVSQDLGPGCPGGPGCPCADDADCDANLCIQDMSGKSCPVPCLDEGDCPQGFKCLDVLQSGGSDVLFACVPPVQQCRPCKTDTDCDGPYGWGGACVGFGPKGGFCGVDCQGADDCVSGYVCAGEGAGGPSTACVPAQGAECQCRKEFLDSGYTTICYEENQFGKCEAEITCGQACPAGQAAPEVCDDIDNDCDGGTDEDWPDKLQPCDGDDPDQCESGQMKCTADLNGVECVGDSPHPEECNGVDDDCNGTTDDGFDLGVACDGDDPDDCENGTTTCRPDGTGVECVNEPPGGAVEECNGKDDDCDGQTDEEDAQGCVSYWLDGDGDGYGKTGDKKCLCGPSGDYDATNGDDCDDESKGANPGQAEDCDTVFDDDCDGETNAKDAQDCVDYHYDGDNDGYGTDDFECWCDPKDKYTAIEAGDCEDGNPAVHPGASKCGADADCDGKDLDAGEGCDDGNSEPWDGCWNCQVTEKLVNTWTTQIQWHPSVSTATDGSFVVTWEGQGGSGETKGDIYGRRFDKDGKAAVDQFLVDSFTPLAQQWPFVATHDDGAFFVVWQQWAPDGTEDNVYGRRFGTDGVALADDFDVSGYSGSDEQNPEAAVLPGGATVAVWESSNNIQARRYDADGNSAGGIFEISPTVINEKWHPSVAALADGRFVVVWQSLNQDGGSWGVYGTRFNADGTVDGTEFPVNTHTSDDQAAPVVSGGTDGKFVVVWESQLQDGEGNGIFGQRFAADGTKEGGEFQANTYTVSNQYQPRTTRLTNGGFVVVWTSFAQDASLWGVFGQLYDEAGAIAGSEFQVNTYTDHTQERPQVAPLPGGGFVVVWESFGQDGDNRGIFVQRFDADGKKVY